MGYSVKNIINEVKIALDENVVSTGINDLDLFAERDEDTLKLDEIIRSKIADAARLVVMEAPHWMLDGGESVDPAGITIAWEDRDKAPYGGSIHLGSELKFLRLVAFKMSGWQKVVTDAISEDSQEYLMQKSRFAGVRGNTERPVVAIVNDNSGEALEFYGCDHKERIVRIFRYIPVPEIKDGEIDLCPRLYRPTIYRIAALTAAEVGNYDQAKVMSDTCNGMIE